MSIKFACQLCRLTRRFSPDSSASSALAADANHTLLLRSGLAQKKTAQFATRFLNQAVSFLNLFRSPGGMKAKNFSVFV